MRWSIYSTGWITVFVYVKSSITPSCFNPHCLYLNVWLCALTLTTHDFSLSSNVTLEQYNRSNCVQNNECVRGRSAWAYLLCNKQNFTLIQKCRKHVLVGKIIRMNLIYFYVYLHVSSIDSWIWFDWRCTVLTNDPQPAAHCLTSCILTMHSQELVFIACEIAADSSKRLCTAFLQE